MESTVTQNQQPATQLPAAPRPVNRLVARRSWLEGPVRFWWMSAIAVFLVCIVVTFYNVRAALHDRRLMKKGVQVVAEVYTVNGGRLQRFTAIREDRVPVQLKFRLQNGDEVVLSVVLPRGTGSVGVGQMLPIRYDPDNPSDLTDRVEVSSWPRELFSTLVMSALILLFLAIAEVHRRQILRVWRDGETLDVIVVASKHSAMAPRSRTVRYIPANSFDKRIYSILYPSRLGLLHRGDRLLLLALAQNPGRAIAPELYQRILPE